MLRMTTINQTQIILHRLRNSRLSTVDCQLPYGNSITGARQNAVFWSGRVQHGYLAIVLAGGKLTEWDSKAEGMVFSRLFMPSVTSMGGVSNAFFWAW